MPDTTIPVYLEKEGRYRIDTGETRFECTAKDSGRIVTFAIGGHNVLTTPASNPFNFGSTFWTGPQSDWEWPPPAEVDSDAPYEATIKGDAIELVGPPCPQLGIRVTKRYRAIPDAEGIRVEYEIKNIADKSVTYAPWEISRVPGGGLTFFPTGEGTVPPTIQQPLPTVEKDGITWFTHTEETVTAQHKLFADGKEGWIAHVDGDLLFVKTFEDRSMKDAAPGEAEIEIYAVPEYVEVEQQGAYLPIATGSSVVWSVDWYLRKLPTEITFAAGNASLVDVVKQTIGK